MTIIFICDDENLIYLHFYILITVKRNRFYDRNDVYSIGDLYLPILFSLLSFFFFVKKIRIIKGT